MRGSIALNSKIALLKTRLENSKQIELRKDHYALGKKLYESRMFLSMQDEIETLEQQIKEKGERAVIEENETKGAMLKRVGKNAAMTAESELLSLKMRHCMTLLGELACDSANRVSLAEAENEFAAIITIVAVKNIPGLLEITILQRLPIDAGGRFAATA